MVEKRIYLVAAVRKGVDEKNRYLRRAERGKEVSFFYFLGVLWFLLF